MAENTHNGRREGRPSFQFYPGDFTGSPKVRRMTLEERGAYITLLCDAWTDRGIEPDSIADRLCVEPEDAARLMAGTLGRCFELRDGVLVNPRQERERERLEERSRTNASNGSAGGKRSQANAKRSPSKRSTKSSDREAVVEPSGQGRAGPGPALGRAEPEPEPGEGSEPDPTPKSPRRARHARCTLEEQLAEIEFSTLRSDIVEAAREWAAYRAERRPAVPPLGARSWRMALREAIRDPATFVASVQFSIRQGYQGLFPPSHANGSAKPARPTASVANVLDAFRGAADLMGETQR